MLFLGILILMSGCDKELAEITENKVLRKLSVQEQELINSTNNLSLDILKVEYQQNNQKNFFFSPVSVGMALGMVYNGVGENEKSQIQHIMGLESLVEKEINKSYNELLNFLQVSNDRMDISYANSLWFSTDMDINEDFRSRVMAYYDAEISELNFKKSSSIDFINSWGNLKTNGSFEKLIEIAPSPNTDIFFINAFSLNSEWKRSSHIFLSKSNFYNSNGAPQEINTLNWNGLHVRVHENERYSFVEIPFESDQFFLSVIQPENLESLEGILGSFTMDEFKNLRENSYGYNANVSLPKINFSSDTPLKATLSQIGLNELFLSTTDLSPSFTENNNQISQIIHKAKIVVTNEIYHNDTDGKFTDSNLKLVRINKPFLYFVHENYTKTILFAGYFAKPTD